jgi:hypothetical protein
MAQKPVIAEPNIGIKSLCHNYYTITCAITDITANDQAGSLAAGFLLISRPMNPAPLFPNRGSKLACRIKGLRPISQLIQAMLHRPRSGFVAMAEGTNIGGGAGANRSVVRFLLDKYRRAKFPPPRNARIAA